MKKLVAYSSVSHLGFVVLGIYSFTRAGMDGAVFVMLAHGVSTGALFLLLGMIYDRRHTYEIKQYGGLATPMPRYATLFLLIMLASVGLPLMNGFIGEFLVLSGAFQAKAIYGIIAASGVIWSAFYLLWLYQRTFYGTITNPVNASLPDIDLRERTVLWPLAVLALVMGVFPNLWLNPIDASVSGILEAQTVASGVSARRAIGWPVPVAEPTAHALPVQVQMVLK
jgi:NADH-quinone oxidoreductase subunit M